MVHEALYANLNDNSNTEAACGPGLKPSACRGAAAGGPEPLTQVRERVPHLCDEDHVLSTELLLQLPHKPHLDLLEGLQLRYGNEDDDGLSAASNINFLKTQNHKTLSRAVVLKFNRFING